LHRYIKDARNELDLTTKRWYPENIIHKEDTTEMKEDSIKQEAI